MVIDSCLVERPVVVGNVDRGAPVLQPHVPAVLDKHVHEIAPARSPEDFGAHPGAVHEQDGPPGGLTLATHVDHVALQAVARCELHDALEALAHPLPSGPYTLHSSPANSAPKRPIASTRCAGSVRNVVSWRAKSSGWICRMPLPRTVASASCSGATCPSSTRVNSVVVSDHTSRPCSWSTSLKPVIVRGWPSPSAN